MNAWGVADDANEALSSVRKRLGRRCGRRVHRSLEVDLVEPPGGYLAGKWCLTGGVKEPWAVMDMGLPVEVLSDRRATC
jgi:hypothetical protein